MKIISENINEFKKGLDPVDSLGLGRKAMIDEWLNEIIISNDMKYVYYDINKDYTINFYGNFDISLPKKRLSNFPDFIQFEIVNGYMSIGNNNFTTLKGSPKKVTDDFYCYGNKLTSLKYMPEYIEGIFSCNSNLRIFSEDEVRRHSNIKGKLYL